MEETGTGTDALTFTIGVSSGDLEIDAMRMIMVAMQPLDYKSRERVARWAEARFVREET